MRRDTSTVVVLAGETGEGLLTALGRAGFQLGPLRAIRPHRVAVATPAANGSGTERPSGGREQYAAVLRALGSLRHGPWWPSIGELIGAARQFYPGGLAEGEPNPGAEGTPRRAERASGQSIRSPAPNNHRGY